MLSPEYWTLLILILLCTFFYKRKWLAIVPIAYMTLLALLRDSCVGSDFHGYEVDYDNINSFRSFKDVEHGFETGFMCLILLYKQFFSDYKAFISLLFIPCIVGTFKFIKDHKVNLSLSIFFYYTLPFYFSSFNLMRQMAVASLCMMYLPMLYKKKYKEFALCVTITSLLFHKSELMFLLFIPIYYWVDKYDTPLKKYPLYLAVLLSFLVFYVGNEPLRVLFALPISLFFGGEDGYIYYIMGVNDDYGNGTSILLSVLAIILIYVKNPNNYKFQTYIFILSVVAYNIFNTFSSFSARVSYSYMLISIVLLPQMFFDKRTKYRYIFIPIIITFCLIYFFNRYYIGNAGEINPYVFRQ